MIHCAGYLKSSLAGLGLVLMSTSPPATAFDYAEHYAITLESLHRACAAFASDNPVAADEQEHVTATGVLSVERLCSSKKAAECLAHMAAVAGDYAVKPEDFVDAVKLGLLDRDGTDCTALGGIFDQASSADASDAVAIDALPDFAAHLKCISDSGAEVQHRDAVLIDGWVKRKWQWIKLAASNATHFHPQSGQKWDEYSLPSADPSPQYVMARHAFSMHFLEDSFAAGHIGLNRGEQKFGEWGARHDYGHAYHDDLNARGQYLRNRQGNLWYAYGDKNLCTPTLYLDVAKWSAAGNPALGHSALLSIVETVFCLMGRMPDSTRMAKREDKFASELASAIDTLIREDTVTEMLVASLPIERSFLAFCSFFVNCNKLEIVVIDSTKAMNHIDHVQECQPVLKDQPEMAHAALYQCYDTKEHVLRAATAAQSQFLRRLSITQDAQQAVETSTSKLLPTQYVPLDLMLLSDVRGANALNFDPLLLRSSFAFKRTCEYVQLPHTAWGFDLSYAESPRTGTPEWSLDFGPQTRLQGAPVTVRMALLTRHGNHTSVLDQFEAGYDFARVTESAWRVLSVAPSVHGGVDAIFRGGERRNAYAGAGLDLEMDVGRYVLQLGFARDIHWTYQATPYWQSRFTFGLKIPSMDLTPPPRSSSETADKPATSEVVTCPSDGMVDHTVDLGIERQ